MSILHARVFARGLLALSLALASRAAVLDARVQGADLELSWDTATTEDVLRGTSPDNLLPWLSNVTSPVVGIGESAPGAPPTFYKIASGSNMAWRMELTIDSDPAQPMFALVTLPERSFAVTAPDLFVAWPTLVEVAWWDDTQTFRHVMSTPAGLLGDLSDPLPRQGAVDLTFSQTTTLQLAGSDEPAYAGMTALDLPPRALLPRRMLAVPPHAIYRELWQILCGRRGTDWQDANGDDRPDVCGTDVDVDGDLDTGLWQGKPRSCELGGVKGPWPGYLDGLVAATFNPFGGHGTWQGDPDRGVPLGRAVWVMPDAELNLPYEVPRW